MKTRRRFLILGLITVSALLLVALGRIFAAQAGTGPKLRPTPTPEVLSNGWYRFTDWEAGYSISYPSDAHLDAQISAGLDYRVVSIRFPASVGDSNQSMEIIVYPNSERSSLNEIIQQEIYQGKLPKSANGVRLTPVKIAGLDAAKMEMTPFFPAILVSGKGRVYFISLPMKMLVGNPPTQGSVDLYYDIIKTFTLN
jgi:hypothetical protein